MPDLKTLNILVKKAGQYHPLHGDRLATHLPMALIALNRLGASDEKLNAFFEESITELETLDNLDEATSVNQINKNLGDSSKYKNYLKYFITQIEAHGADNVLRQVLPTLLPGIAASAFHALIRLAYAIETNNHSEIAISLAYWCAEFQAIDLCDETTNDTLAVILTKLAPLGVNHAFSPGIIVDRMTEICALLKQGKCKVQPKTINLAEVRKLCLRTFYAKNDFTLLHTVTGCHALSIILPYIENIDQALREFWQAVLVAYLSTGIGYEDVAVKSSTEHCDFNPIVLAAQESDDAHVIKLVYTCVSEYSKHEDFLYYKVAKRAV
jgi:hypothetical protein